MEELLITWNEKLSVKCFEIDAQHKKMVEIINHLHQSFKDGKANDLLRSVFDDLERYASYHFETEESYFYKFKYSESEAHIKEHKSFSDQLAAFKYDYLIGKKTTAYELFAFLKEWLVAHILHSDMEYVDCFLANGLD